MALVLLTAPSAGAREIQEAQLIGHVKNHAEVQKNESLSEGTFEIEFSIFGSSAICTLVVAPSVEKDPPPMA